VVAVGLMLVVPLADVDVNVPGLMATLVAPAVAQLSVLLAPELTLVGFAEKEVIVGMEVFSEAEGDEPDEPQFTKPTLANRIRIRISRRRCELPLASVIVLLCALPV
jgi:hypothetical protein